MSDDIPQDQVEAVARAICSAGSLFEPDDSNMNSPNGKQWGVYLARAIAAIRVLTPLIAAVERERCATLAQKEADFQYDMAQCVGREQEQSYMIYEYGQKIASRICAAIRSVKGAVT